MSKTRTLQQLAHDEAARFPLGATTIRQHLYVDDILAGEDSPDRAREVQTQLVELLRAGGFALSKWASSWPDLCPRMEQEKRLLPPSEVVGALGVSWDLQTDALVLKVTPLGGHADTRTWTKRMALSNVARLFNPLGWAAPVLVYAKSFRASLGQLNEVRLPRWVHFGAENARVELHGFSDASERAYAAVVYLRTVDNQERVATHLLARTKVAPVKTQSVPRLELCGAVLLAKLLDRIVKGLNMESCPVYVWTDAQVVLAWLRSHASRWKPFVAHRVAEIQGLLPGDHWNYVQTSSNPADLATRGIDSSELLGRTLWWHGPAWLGQAETSWSMREISPSASIPEEERRAVAHTNQVFLHNARKLEPAQSGFLTSSEQHRNRLTWIKQAQQKVFPDELMALRTGRSISVRSPLRGLYPMLDEEDLLRVGGRLQAALLPFGERHPLLLPKDGHLTLLVIRQAHHATLHGGPQLMRGYLLRHFWIPGGASRIRQVAHQCVRCARFKADLGQQRIGRLLAERVQPARPFLFSGVDYAAFKRFTNRRGRCTLLLSDNGTNFRGADAELRGMFRAASSFSNEEADVRSVKHHLRRLLGDQVLTYEELATLLCQIEGCLNSRPLGPLSQDSSDLVALTPGHFLVGEPLTNLLEPVTTDPPATLTNRWRLVSSLRSHFRQRWAKEYLYTLQQSSKWHRQRANLKEGDLVLVKDEILPLAKWALGRIVEGLFDCQSLAKENHAGLRHLVDGVLKHMRALKAIGRPTDCESWDDLIIHLITGKLDHSTNKEWKNGIKEADIPTLQRLTDFIEHRCYMFEAVNRKI
ncbi:PREDICTED: uncharacterized protein LOC105450474 [Wasmannia auropunctata]|uniref:uncharacterized protein LOC105450474 n=1 Tax=Wasmannia auropunctata TaxID=64793 RepID=UPI0005EFD837|nr:PREDICTED: uncharacterized protein LOC105450474 [Wasmannia auropunctata]